MFLDSVTLFGSLLLTDRRLKRLPCWSLSEIVMYEFILSYEGYYGQLACPSFLSKKKKKGGQAHVTGTTQAKLSGLCYECTDKKSSGSKKHLPKLK